MQTKNFEDLAKRYLEKLLEMKPGECRCIHFVGDRYDFDTKNSLEDQERQRRSSTVCSAEYSLADALDIPT